MLKIVLADINGRPAHFEDYDVQGEGAEARALVITTVPQTHGLFKSVTRATAGTSIVTAPTIGGAIVLTDLIVSTDKKPNSSVTINLTDDAETITIMTLDTDTAPVNIAIPFTGRIAGWKNARLEVTTIDVVSATVTCGFVKEQTGLSFLEWDAKRNGT
jgi:hypothetical protein